jgi:hypothetical protein
LAVCTLLITACGFATACTQTAPNSGQYGTWRWDGSNWSQLANTSQGTTFLADQLFYSVALGGLINMNGTKWSGTGWAKNVGGPTLPRAAGNQKTAIVLDEANGQLLFLDPNASTMWAWSAGSWIPVVLPAQWPTARYLSSGGVAYDPYRQMVVIVSCCSAGTLETSVWDGHAIRARATNGGLQCPSQYLIVPDGRGHMLALGQDDVGGPTKSFSWDGEAWSAMTSAATLPQGVVSVAYDFGNDQILAVGGDDGKNFHTWRWHENAWQLIATTDSPPGGRISNLVYDPLSPGFLITVLPAAGLGGII